MAEVDLKEMKKNFIDFLEITEICIKLRISFLKKKYGKEAEKIFFEEILKEKEKIWKKKDF